MRNLLFPFATSPLLYYFPAGALCLNSSNQFSTTLIYMADAASSPSFSIKKTGGAEVER